jgi:hypothetical protein
LEQCREPIDSATTALAACWQEIAEHVGTTNISVQANNIGQQVASGTADMRAFGKQGVT